jgi:NADPH:quinone reductase-like Zn-dependent oxidoreductase
MKAIVWTKYGLPDSLQLQEIEQPAPKDDQTLVKIHAAGVTAGDCEMRRLQLPLGLSFPVRIFAGLIKPKRIPVLGQEFAGEVVEVGEKVTSFKHGDQVFGTTGFGFGAYAEYICLPSEPGDAEGVLALKPANLTFEEAAVLPTAGLEALHYLMKGKAGPGKKVLIIGGGGSIGTFAIQLGKLFEAEVTGVDSTDKQEMMRSLGADQVVDYIKTDYTKTTEEYDLIIDVVGKHSISRRLKMLKPAGTYNLAFAKPSHLLLAWWTLLASNKKLKIQSANQNKEDLEFLADLLESRKLISVIDRQYSLENTPDAHRYVEAGGKKGNVSITVADK